MNIFLLKKFVILSNHNNVRFEQGSITLKYGNNMIYMHLLVIHCYILLNIFVSGNIRLITLKLNVKFELFAKCLFRDLPMKSCSQGQIFAIDINYRDNRI